MNLFLESRDSAPIVGDSTNQFSMNIESRDDSGTPTSGSQKQRKRFAEHQLERNPTKRSALASSHYLLDNQATYCFECEKDFCRPSVLSRHLRSAVHDPSRKFLCPYEWCGESFTRRDSCNRHIDAQHGISKLTCSKCGAQVRKDALKEHQATNLCRTTAAQLDEARKTSGEYPPSSVDTSPYPNHSTGFGTPASYIGTHITTPDEAGPSQAATPYPNNRSSDSVEAIEVDNDDDNGDDNDFSTLASKPSQIENQVLKVLDSKPGSHPPPHSPPLCQTALLDPHPNMVPDSPRPFFGEEAFDPFWADHCTDMESLEADVVQWRKQVLPLLKGPANGQATHPTRKLSRWSRRERYFARRMFNKLSYGSKCALCREHLGHSPEAVIQHAKAHIQDNEAPALRCNICEVDFAYERDLRLHRRPIEMMRFSQEHPAVERFDDTDWVGGCSQGDRELFLRGLRCWERLQLGWFLKRVDDLIFDGASLKNEAGPKSTVLPTTKLTSKSDKGSFRRTVVDRLEKSLTACSDIPRSKTPHTDVAVLIEKFNTASLIDSCVSDATELPTLHVASSKGHVGNVQQLLQAGADIDELDASGRSAVMLALKNKQFQIVRLLLKHGAKVARESSIRTGIAGRQSVHGAISCGRLLAEALSEFSASAGQTEFPLIYACREIRSPAPVVQMLLEAGETAASCDADGRTALHWACIQDSLEAAQHLLVCGAIADARDKAGSAPMTYVLKQCIPDTRRKDEWVRLLLKHKANVNALDLDGCTPLMLAAMTSQHSIASILLRHGAYPNIVSKNCPRISIDDERQHARRSLDRCKGYTALSLADLIANPADRSRMMGILLGSWRQSDHC